MRIHVTIMTIDQVLAIPELDPGIKADLVADGVVSTDFEFELLEILSVHSGINFDANSDGSYDVYSDPLEPQFTNDIAELSAILTTDYFAYTVEQVG